MVRIVAFWLERQSGVSFVVVRAEYFHSRGGFHFACSLAPAL